MNINERLAERKLEVTDYYKQFYTLRGLDGCDPAHFADTVRVWIKTGTKFVEGGPMWARFEGGTR